MARLSGVSVRRRCRVPSGVLHGLTSDDVWRAANELADATDRCRLLGSALADRIALLIPDADAEARRMLLRAKRDAFNARPLRDPIDDDYRDAIAERDRCAAALDRHCAALTASTEVTLRAALADADLAYSVELSVPGLSTADLGTTSARARRRTLTLLRLVQRAVTKPSPFARFTDSTLLLPGATEQPPRSHVRVDRRAIDWVRATNQDYLTTNPTTTIDADRISWLAGGAVRGIARTEALVALLDRLRTPTRSAQPLRSLVQSGLIEAGPLLPGWGRDTLAAAADAVGDPAVRDALRALQAVESKPSAEGAAAGLRALAVACGQAEVGSERLLLTEDLVGVGAPECRPSAAILAELGRVQRIAPLLGPELPFQLAAAATFRERFGDADVPLLTAFRWFVQSGREAADRLVAESVEPVLAEVLALRGELVGGLAKLAGETESVECDGAWLTELADALPVEVADWTNVAWPAQWAGDRLVLNGISVGYGRFPARIAGTLDAADLDRLRADIAATVPPEVVPVDIAARFGATANEHPLLLPGALAYPGSALECDPAGRVDLSTITVRVHDGRLVATSTAFPGRTLLPVPHNATLPSIAPTLFRWLSRLGPSQGSTLALWDLVDAVADHEGIRHYPRLTLGDVVLCRRTWKVPGAELPTGHDVLSWARWSRRTGVPRRSFLRGTTLPEPWDVVRGLASDHRVQDARSRSGGAVRKPAYVDLAQPLGRPEPADTLTFTEALPDPLALGADEHVVEYVFETCQPFRPRRTS